jgi:glycosyltransferase involved in cell wall biosynthesis
MMMVTVCMATFNGEDFVIRQLDSVLKQLSDSDQVVIVDDGSTDQTVERIKEAYGNRIEVYVNESNLGVIKSFDKAISLAKGDYIFLCDQDDIWEDQKVKKVLEKFEQQNAVLVVHDAYVVDGSIEIIHPSWNEYNRNSVEQSIFGNVLKNAYTGCMMAFKKELKNTILPFPTSIEMHDQWIALVCKIKGYKLVYIDEPLMKYVRHGNNVTGMKRRPLIEQIKGRIGTIRAIREFKKTH